MKMENIHDTKRYNYNVIKNEVKNYLYGHPYYQNTWGKNIKE